MSPHEEKSQHAPCAEELWSSKLEFSRDKWHEGWLEVLLPQSPRMPAPNSSLPAPEHPNDDAATNHSSFFASKGRTFLGILPFFAGFCVLVGITWFLCDDSYISFRYVRNLVEGNGLVFNRGEAVEGYTNFLWVLELAALWKLFRIPPDFGSIGLSILCTLAVFAMVFAESAKHEEERVRPVQRVLALGLLMMSTTFAAWTTSGLETRQFTALVVAAVFAAGNYRERDRFALLSSCFAALAALTRPEGLMVGCFCIGFIVGDSFWRKNLSLGLIRNATLPFAGIVAAHFLFRYLYYGDLLPNTYYAKHVRHWYDAGFDYFVTAGIETGAYLLVPLALIGAWRRMAKENDRSGLLYLALIFAHVAYLMRVGGDHFEFRPLDFYWPLLAFLAIEGLFHLAEGVGATLFERFSRRVGLGWIVAPCFVVLAVYCSSMQLQIYLDSRKRHAKGPRPIAMQVDVTKENAAWLYKLPMMNSLCEIANPARARGIVHFVGTRILEHRRLGGVLRYRWKKLEDAPRPFLPEDGIAAMGMVGVMPFHLPDISIIDIKGLTDAVVAHNKVDVANEHRIMAHDRNPPPGYLHERRINITPLAPVESSEEALRHALFATEVAKGMWLPFDAADHEWVARRFEPSTLASRYLLAGSNASPPEFSFRGKNFQMDRVLESFEGVLGAGWSVRGNVLSGIDGAHVKSQGLIFGRVGEGVLTTFDETRTDSSIGSATSPEFNYRAGDWLFLLVSGGNDSSLRVEVRVDGRSVGSFRGRSSERLELAGVKLPTSGSLKLNVSIVDESTGAWGHLNVDHLFLAREKQIASASAHPQGAATHAAAPSDPIPWVEPVG